MGLMDRTDSLAKKAYESLAQFLLALGTLLFVSAWSFRDWQAWAFLAVFAAGVTLITVYFLKRDPALIERRMKAGAGAETEKRQKIIQTFASLFFFALIAFPGIDRRFGGAHVSPSLVLAGDGLVALGLLIIFFVFKTNSYTSGIIAVEKDQTVISTGPYRVVRHPMYSGALILMAGTPIALGSLWGLLLCIPLAATLVWRLIDEERYLCRHLPGYESYRAKARYRLIPGIY
jgi:protein-S-isoprenylcysteine O-methyltransferase Ste14